jgi:hypothetical protein
MDVKKDLLNQIIRLTIITQDFLSYAANQSSVAPEEQRKSIPVTLPNTCQEVFVA